MKTIAIIGAGLSGLSLAKQLRGLAQVTVFEKSRGYGGRMATRLCGSQHFDHGAQFFTARARLFKQFLQPYIADNVVALWAPKIVTLEAGHKTFKREWFEPHYIAVPGMSTLGKTLAQEIEVSLQCKITAVKRTVYGWQLTDSNGDKFGPFDWLITAVPAPQATVLLADCPTFSPSFNEQLTSVSFSPCVSVMLGFESKLDLHFGAAVVKNSPVSWIAGGAPKTNQLLQHSLVLHSDNDWAQLHFDKEPEQLGISLLGSLQDLLGNALAAPTQMEVHRWRYAKTTSSAEADFLLDVDNQLAACGDWCRGDRVEDAFISGVKLGMQLQKHL